MEKIRFSLLLYLYVLAGFFSYLLLLFYQQFGGTPPFLHPLVAGVEIMVIFAIFWGGWQVRKLRDGKPSKIRLVQAPIVLAASQMGAIWSALFLGYLTGFSILLIQLWHSQYLWNYGVRILLFLIITIVMLAVSLLVEKWCESDTSDPKDKKQGKPSTSYLREEESGCAARN